MLQNTCCPTLVLQSMPFLITSNFVTCVAVRPTLPQFRDEAEFLFHRIPSTRSSQTLSAILHQYIFSSPCLLTSCSPSFQKYGIRTNRGMPQPNCNFGRPTYCSYHKAIISAEFTNN